MLVLTRKIGEVITLGDPRSLGAVIEVTVADVRGDSVRLSIAAPQDVAVHRKEVYLLIQQENEAASQTPASALASTAGKTRDQVRRMQK